jgi:hypothetical protein
MLLVFREQLTNVVDLLVTPHPLAEQGELLG